jgi:hypothetical protein
MTRYCCLCLEPSSWTRERTSPAILAAIEPWGQLQGNNWVDSAAHSQLFRTALVTDRCTIIVARVTLPEGVPSVNLGNRNAHSRKERGEVH